MKEGQVRISVIILTRGRLSEVLRAIQSVYETTAYREQIEIIVADNNDDGLTSGEIARRYPEVSVIRMGGNKGVTIPRNLAVKQSRGEYLYFMDDDAWVSPNVFDALLDVMEQDTIGEIFLAASRTRYLKADGTPAVAVLEERPEVFLETPPYENNIMIRRSVFEELGGFNEYLFFGTEGGDLALRAYYRGYYSVMATRSIGYHPTARTKKPSLLNELRLIEATCISTKMTWPWLPCWGRLIKIALVRPFELERKYRAYAFLDAWRIILKVVFTKYPRDKEISWKKWKQYRGLLGYQIAVTPGRPIEFEKEG